MRRLAFALALLAPLAARADVGLGIYFANGQYDELLGSGQPGALHVVDGPARYLQEVDLVAKQPTSYHPDPLVMLAPVTVQGDFAGLDWSGVAPVPAADGGEDWRIEVDGVHWMHSIYFRGAVWMDAPSLFTAVPLGAHGVPVGAPILGFAGMGDRWLRGADDFFERRFVARVVAHGCPARDDCTGASWYAEGIAHLRGALEPWRRARAIPPATASLAVFWSADPLHPRTVQVVHDPAPAGYGYGLSGALEVVSAPPGGVFAPGDTVTLRVTYRDGGGRRLFPAGTMPSYGDALLGSPAAAGIRYLSFADDPILYWAHKNVQAENEVSLTGPVDRIRQIGSATIAPANLFDPQITAATVAQDGYSTVIQAFPSTLLIFPCLLAPTFPSPVCFLPPGDTFSFVIPSDALPGTWSAQIKTRRLWMGEPLQAAAVATLQVGSAAPTAYAPRTGHCETCHTGRAALPVVGHGLPGNGVGAPCYACHSGRGPAYPAGYYYFEPDAAIDIRVHRVHFQSDRFASAGGDMDDCASCHLQPPSGPARL